MTTFNVWMQRFNSNGMVCSRLPELRETRLLFLFLHQQFLRGPTHPLSRRAQRRTLESVLPNRWVQYEAESYI